VQSKVGEGMTRQSDAWKGSVCGSIYIVLFGYGVFAFSSFGNASSNSDAREAVRCSEIAFSRSVEAKDEGYFASFIDDARLLPSLPAVGPGWPNAERDWNRSASAAPVCDSFQRSA
jgi:hypothetical protein